jgi:hypothetical protein
MKTPPNRSRTLLAAPLAAALLALPGWLGAQTAPAPSAAASTSTAEETIKLNPFEVVDEKDGSFQSNNIGTGSRLALDLKDAPVPYSIINREFIDALGITDLKEAAAWSTGNTFYKTDNGSDSRGLAGQYQSRGNVTGNVTATNAPDNYGTQRNFYQNASISGDSYSVESYDFGRGPNAALFGQGAGTGGGDAGNGGLAGVSSVQTKRARFDRSTTAVSLELGSWNQRRVTVDYNRPINDRWGIRVNVVDLDKEGWRKNDKQATRGLSLASTYKLNTGGEIRLDLSNEKRDQHTVGTGWDEFISGWDGATVFRGPLTNSMRSTNTALGLTSVANGSYGTIQVLGTPGLTWNGESQGIQTINGNPHYLYNTGDGTVMNWQNFGISRRADSTSRTPLWSSKAPNGAAFVRADLPLQGNGQPQPAFGVGRSFFAEGNLPADIFNRAIQNSRFRIPSQRYNSSSDIPLVTQISRDLQLTYTQQVGTNLFFELGGDANRNNNTNRNLDDPNPGGRSAYLDLNQIRPDGSPNTNFLGAYSTVPMVQRLNTTSDRTLRANVAYILNAGAWGTYNFNVQGSASQRKSKQREYQVSMMVNADNRQWGQGSDQVKSLNLWSDPVHGWKEPINGTQVRFTDVTWDAAQNNPTIQPTVLRQPAWILTNWGESFVQSRYYTAQATAKYWQDKVIFTGAYRRDLNFGNSKSALNRGQLPTNWNGSDAIYRPDAPADYFKMTYVNKNTTTGVPIGNGLPLAAVTRPTANNAFGVPVPLAVYNGERFRDDYNNPQNRSYANNKSYGVVVHVMKQLSLVANFADSYTPRNSITLDMNNQIRDPQKSKSRDLGFTFNLLNNRLTGKYNYYVQTRQNDSLNPLTGINGLYQANDASNPDSTASGRNIRNLQDIANGTDYQDRRNFGGELELAFNFNRALRFTANGTAGSYSLDNIGRLNKAYVPAHAADFLQILQDAGGMLDTSQKPVGAPNAPGLAVINPSVTPALVADRDSAITNFNNIYVNYQNLITQRTVRVSLPRSANVFADYTVQTGKAKGLRIGVGVQWQKALVGSRNADTTLDPSNPIPTAIAFPGRNGDASTRLWGTNNYVTQMNLAYSFKLKNGNPLAVSLRINNFLNDRSKIYGDNGVFGGAGFPGTTGLRQPQGNLLLPNRENSPYVLSDIHEPINARLTASYTFGNKR